jgi:hypothetical protein
MNSNSNVVSGGIGGSFGIGSGAHLGRSFGGIGASIINNNSMSSSGLVPNIRLNQLRVQNTEENILSRDYQTNVNGNGVSRFSVINKTACRASRIRIGLGRALLLPWLRGHHLKSLALISTEGLSGLSLGRM